MRKYVVPTYHHTNKSYRLVYSDCTYNMACAQLDHEGFVCDYAEKDIQDDSITYIYGKNRDGKNLRYVWDDDKQVLYMDESRSFV